MCEEREGGGGGGGVLAMLGKVGPCEHPIVLQAYGRLDDGTGEIAKTREVRVRCGSRLMERCASCSQLYRDDFKVICRAGRQTGEAAPSPLLWITLTAPSFGRLHTAGRSRSGKTVRCCPRGRPYKCPGCGERVVLRKGAYR
jgi:Replication initiator protein, pSAM2